MYFALEIELPEEAIELLQAVVDATGPLGMELRDRTLKPPPGAKPVPAGRIQLTAFYESEVEAAEALRQVHSELPDAQAQSVPVPQEDWAQAWKKHVRPVRVGRVWVGPSWELGNAGDARVKVVIDPGMAFGTGDHATTALCLRELDRALERCPGGSVLDVGTGSGVLAIAAKKLGAGKVVANDVDPVAVRVAKENAERNETPAIDITDRPVERMDGSFDVVVANIVAPVLAQLAPRLAARTAADGVLLLAGILGPQASEVLDAYRREGMRQLHRRSSGEWVLLALGRR